VGRDAGTLQASVRELSFAKRGLLHRIDGAGWTVVRGALGRLIRSLRGAGDRQRLEIVNLPFAAHLRPGIDDDPAAIDATILRCIDVGRVNNLIDRVKRRSDPFAWKLVRQVLDSAFGASSVAGIATEFKLTERASSVAVPPSASLAPNVSCPSRASIPLNVLRNGAASRPVTSPWSWGSPTTRTTAG